MNLQENIQRIKDVMGLTEATTQLDGGFTTDLDKGPQNHATRRVGNWQSDNAWDLMAPEGTVVKSYTKGKVSKIFTPTECYNRVVEILAMDQNDFDVVPAVQRICSARFLSLFLLKSWYSLKGLRGKF